MKGQNRLPGYRSIVASLSLTLLFLGSLAAGATPAGASGQHGLRITLTLPAGPFRRDELLRVHVTATNVSRTPIDITRDCYDGTNFILSVWAIDPAGNPRYPPAVPSLPPAPCIPPHVVRALKPGQTIKATLLVVARTTRLAGIVPVELRSPGVTEDFDVIGGIVHLRLLPAAPAPVTVTQTPSGPSVRVQRAPGDSGPLRYQYWAQCPSTDGTEVSTDQTVSWQIADGDSFIPASPTCQTPLEWHAVAGWLGESVTYIDYVKRSASVQRETRQREGNRVSLTNAGLLAGEVTPSAIRARPGRRICWGGRL